MSVIADIKNIFENLGHVVDQWSLSSHRWLFNLEECKSPVINSSNWKSLDESMCERFYEEHKEDLDKYDAFISIYPPCFLKLFEKFNKPIIVVCATRYDYPLINDNERLKWLEDSLNNNTNLILVTNNEFDKNYCELFLKKEWEWIPSLCDYTNAKYKPTQDKSVVFSKFQLNLGPDMVHQSHLGKYSWDNLYSFEGIVHFPYNVSTMSIFEQHQAGVPLRIPSLDLALELISKRVPLFSEIVFPSKNPSKSPQSFLNKEWLSYSDFYNGTIKCTHFDSLDSIKPNGSYSNNSNKEFIYDKWNSILGKI